MLHARRRGAIYRAARCDTLVPSSDSLGTFLLSRTAQDAFTALTATCTHEGCAITGFSGSQYVCPCHGSRFTTGGGVVNGPATRSLQQYPTQFANNVLSVTV